MIIEIGDWIRVKIDRYDSIDGVVVSLSDGNIIYQPVAQNKTTVRSIDLHNPKVVLIAKKGETEVSGHLDNG